jgi:hypothetical protein
VKWCRLHNEAATDPKLRAVAIEVGQPTYAVAAVWLAMLCHASGNDAEARGTLAGWRDGVCGAALDMPPNVVAAIRGAMADLLLDGDRLTGWDRRQSDAEGSAARTRAWRDRKRAQVTEPEASPPSPSQGVTSQGVTVTHGDDRREESRGEETPVSPIGETPPLRGASEPPGPLDIRAQLWAEGKRILRALAGSPPNRVAALVGRWLRDMGDDCAALLAVLRDAEATRPVEPIAWIAAAVEVRASRVPATVAAPRPGAPRSGLDLLREEGILP